MRSAAEASDDPSTAASLDATIEHVEQLYRAITGRNAPPGDEPYAPIPAEKDPAEHVEEQMNRLLGVLGSPKPQRDVRPAWTPPLSVWEDESDVVLCFDLPGIEREQVQLVMHDGVLTVSGVRAADTNGLRLRSAEPAIGAFRRVLRVPPGVRSSDLRAQMKNGVLKVHLARAAQQAAPQRVPLM
jgi:HSP20 family protein